MEDTPKNTAPAFAASTFYCKDEEVLCFLPSDHYIKNNKKLRYFAIDKNFKIIKKYNNSDYYALIVGDLANKIKNIY